MKTSTAKDNWKPGRKSGWGSQASSRIAAKPRLLRRRGFSRSEYPARKAAAISAARTAEGLRPVSTA